MCGPRATNFLQQLRRLKRKEVDFFSYLVMNNVSTLKNGLELEGIVPAEWLISSIHRTCS